MVILTHGPIQKLCLAALFLCLISAGVTRACTVVSAVAADGTVWNANNEDGPFGVANFINVYPRTPKTEFGYYTLSYFSPRYGNGAYMQGGMNEAGLTFDFNAINEVKGFDPSTKEAYPDGDDAILPNILANMDSVEEVVAFFDQYWFQNGFTSAQMHVADKHGTFAIISASGVELVKGGSLISTNFDICAKESASSCWRYPVARTMLASGASWATMMSICKSTEQQDGSTMYSNVQNLSTGDIWFMSKHDPNVTVYINISDLLAKGARSYTFSNLNAINEGPRAYEWEKPTPIKLSKAELDAFTGKYVNLGIGMISVSTGKGGLLVDMGDGNPLSLYFGGGDEFHNGTEDIRIAFLNRKDGLSMKVYENGWWSFTAQKQATSE